METTLFRLAFPRRSRTGIAHQRQSQTYRDTMNQLTFAHELRGYLALCQEVFDLVQREGVLLRQEQESPAFDCYQTKKGLLPRLNQWLDRLHTYRLWWQDQDPRGRRWGDETATLLRQVQDLVMKIIVMDRENEQTLLRRGLIPAGQLASFRRFQPREIAAQYQRHHAPAS